MAIQATSDRTNFRPAFRGNEDKPAAREGWAMERSRLADSQEQACRLSSIDLEGAALALSLLNAADACFKVSCFSGVCYLMFWLIFSFNQQKFVISALSHSS